MTAETHTSSPMDLASEIGVGCPEDGVRPPSRIRQIIVLGVFAYSGAVILPPALRGVAETLDSIRQAVSIFFPDLVPPGT